MSADSSALNYLTACFVIHSASGLTTRFLAEQDLIHIVVDDRDAGQGENLDIIRLQYSVAGRQIVEISISHSFQAWKAACTLLSPTSPGRGTRQELSACHGITYHTEHDCCGVASPSSQTPGRETAKGSASGSPRNCLQTNQPI